MAEKTVENVIKEDEKNREFSTPKFLSSSDFVDTSVVETNEIAIDVHDKKKELISPESSSVFVESISDSDIDCESDFSDGNNAIDLNSERVVHAAALSQNDNSTSSFKESQPAQNAISEDGKNLKLIASELSSTAVISESISDTETESDSDYSDKNDSLSIVPSEQTAYSAGPLQTIGASPSFGNVNVSESNDVHIGHKTYINGPVTIKQFVQPKNEDNVPSGGISNQAFISSVSDLNTLDFNLRPPIHQEYHNWKCKGVLWMEKRWGLDIRCKTFLLCFFGILITISICIMFAIFLERTKPSTVLAPSSNKANVFESSNGDNLPQGCWYIDNLTTVLLSVGFLALCCTILTILFSTGAMWIDVSENNFINNKEQGYIQQGCNKSSLLPGHALRTVERKEWLAQPPNGPLDVLKTPVPYVIIAHTATEGCLNQSSCIFHVRYIQSFHIESRGWNDIGYNFLVGGDGSAYEGRGWNYVGAHTKGYNYKSIGIALIGTFTVMDPPDRQYIAIKRLIDQGVSLGKIAKDYKLYAHRQLMPTASPGEHVYAELQKWPHFSTDTPVV